MTPKDDSDSIRSDVYPSLYYDDAAAAIDYIERTFGFRRRLVVSGENGRVVHSELSYGNVVVMVGSTDETRGRVSPLGARGATGGLSIRVEDPDAHHARSAAEGAEIVHPLKDEDYGSRGYMVKDPEGHLWYFGTYRPGGHWSE
jgi:uncharacterized glyoxalase superfamily protein PhnB